MRWLLNMGNFMKGLIIHRALVLGNMSDSVRGNDLSDIDLTNLDSNEISISKFDI